MNIFRGGLFRFRLMDGDAFIQPQLASVSSRLLHFNQLCDRHGYPGTSQNRKIVATLESHLPSLYESFIRLIRIEYHEEQSLKALKSILRAFHAIVRHDEHLRVFDGDTLKQWTGDIFRIARAQALRINFQLTGPLGYGDQDSFKSIANLTDNCLKWSLIIINCIFEHCKSRKYYNEPYGSFAKWFKDQIVDLVVGNFMASHYSSTYFQTTRKHRIEQQALKLFSKSISYPPTRLKIRKSIPDSDIVDRMRIWTTMFLSEPEIRTKRHLIKTCQILFRDLYGNFGDKIEDVMNGVRISLIKNMKRDSDINFSLLQDEAILKLASMSECFVPALTDEVLKDQVGDSFKQRVETINFFLLNRGDDNYPQRGLSNQQFIDHVIVTMAQVTVDWILVKESVIDRVLASLLLEKMLLNREELIPQIAGLNFFSLELAKIITMTKLQEPMHLLQSIVRNQPLWFLWEIAPDVIKELGVAYRELLPAVDTDDQAFWASVETLKTIIVIMDQLKALKVVVEDMRDIILDLSAITFEQSTSVVLRKEAVNLFTILRPDLKHN